MYKLILVREERRGKKRERNINLLFYLLMHSLVDSYMHPERGSNPQTWYIRMMLLPTELPNQGKTYSLVVTLPFTSSVIGLNHFEIFITCQ